MRFRNLFTTTGMILLLSGCSGNTGPYGLKTATWYEHHRNEDIKQLEWCHNHGKDRIEACINAQTGANWRYAKEPQSTPGGVPSNLF